MARKEVRVNENTTATAPDLSNLLRSLPEEARPFVLQFAEAIQARVVEDLRGEIEETAEDAVEEAIDNSDLERLVTAAIRDAMEETDIERAVEREIENADIEQMVQDAIERTKLDDTSERCEEVLDAAQAAAEQAETLASRWEEVSRGGFLRRLRWVVTGR
jgi:hypothetical protein